MNVLVTGANGFVGRVLSDALCSAGINVVAASRQGYESLEKSVRQIIIHAIDAHTGWGAALSNADAVIHLGARVHVMQDSAADPLAEFRSVNLHGTANLARQAAQAGVKRFVYVSSAKVNGENTSQNSSFKEFDQPDPQDLYAISKWEAEQALHAISQETGMEVVIVRPPLVYGPGVKANFAQLLNLVDRGIPLPLGNIKNLRSLIYVGNLADALIACTTHSAAAGHTYLVSDGEDVSTPQLIQAISLALKRPNRSVPIPVALMRGAAKLLGKSAAIERLTQSLVVDSSRIRNELGWVPPYTMAQGLQATADWYRSARVGGDS
jgi:nucleoside-diphosphate-sugar epimerase